MGKAGLGGRSSVYKLGEAELEFNGTLRRHNLGSESGPSPVGYLHRHGLIFCNVQCHAVAQEAAAKAFLRLPHLRLPVGTGSAPPPFNARGYEKCPSVRV
jgi:hypothetical protein